MSEREVLQCSARSRKGGGSKNCVASGRRDRARKSKRATGERKKVTRHRMSEWVDWNDGNKHTKHTSSNSTSEKINNLDIMRNTNRYSHTLLLLLLPESVVFSFCCRCRCCCWQCFVAVAAVSRFICEWPLCLRTTKALCDHVVVDPLSVRFMVKQFIMRIANTYN